MKLANKQKGFTLIELLLYISLTATILLAISVFLATLIRTQIKTQTMSEVEEQGAQVMQLITQTIRNSEAIILPIAGATSTSLTLDVVATGNDPTIFDISSSAMRVKEGVGAMTNITSSNISASNLEFKNLSRTDTAGNIRISFTLSHVNPAGRNEYDYTATFYDSASLR